MASQDDVRRWAWERKIPVHTVGFPPVGVMQAYNRTHPDDPVEIPMRYRRDFVRFRNNTREKNAA